MKKYIESFEREIKEFEKYLKLLDTKDKLLNKLKLVYSSDYNIALRLSKEIKSINEEILKQYISYFNVTKQTILEIDKLIEDEYSRKSKVKNPKS